MSQLNLEDKVYLEKLVENKILENVEPFLLDQKDGVIMVACADGDQMPDVFAKQSMFVLKQRPLPRIHTLALNGGALVVPAKCPLNKELPKGQVILDDIRGAMFLKGIKTIILYAHAPCGAAGLCNLNVQKVIDYLFEAKRIIKESFQDVKVACFFHVDWGNNNKQVYFISAHNWTNKKV